MKNSFDCVIFDLDGTLTDPFEGIYKSINYALAKLGEPQLSPAEIRPFIGPPLKDGYMNILGFDGEKAEKAVSVYRERYCVEGFRENVMIEGAKEILAYLRERGKRTALATLKPQDLAESVLDYFGIREYFEFVGGASLDFSTLNTKSKILRHTLLNLNIFGAEALSRTLMVGDRHHDIDGAKENGTASAGLLSGYGSREEFVAAGADFILKNLAELEKVVT